jgi:hypothetical protein
VHRIVQALAADGLDVAAGTLCGALADPVRLQIRTVVEPELLEPDSDIRAVACDGVVSFTPLTWSMTARTDWQPATDG